MVTRQTVFSFSDNTRNKYNYTNMLKREKISNQVSGQYSYKQIYSSWSSLVGETETLRTLGHQAIIILSISVETR